MNLVPMNLPVVIRPKAEQQLENMARWWAEHHSHEQAERWYAGFMGALRLLSQNADRYPLASEDRKFPFEVRELLYGLGRKPTHRALFTIRPDMVYVILIRHHAQSDVSLEDI